MLVKLPVVQADAQCPAKQGDDVVIMKLGPRRGVIRQLVPGGKNGQPMYMIDTQLTANAPPVSVVAPTRDVFYVLGTPAPLAKYGFQKSFRTGVQNVAIAMAEWFKKKFI